MATNKKEINISNERRSKFLERASISLIAQSPAVAANLSRNFIQSLQSREEDVASTVKKCTSCGSFIVPSYSARRKTRSRPPKTPLSTLNEVDFLTTTYDCNRCGATSVFKRSRKRPVLPSPVSRYTRVQKPMANEITPVNSPRTAHVTNPTNQASRTGSKKRTKSRKAGGLSEMLAQAKSQSQKPDLDLMDFMKGG